MAGVNANTLKDVAAITNVAGTLISIFKDGAYPGVSGDTITVPGSYQVA
jgi:hypothetical protein